MQRDKLKAFRGKPKLSKLGVCLLALTMTMQLRVCDAATLRQVDFFTEFWATSKTEVDGTALTGIKRYRDKNRVQKSVTELGAPAAGLSFGSASPLSKQSDDKERLITSGSETPCRSAAPDAVDTCIGYQAYDTGDTKTHKLVLFQLQVDGDAASVKQETKVNFLAYQRVGTLSDQGWLALPRNTFQMQDGGFDANNQYFIEVPPQLVVYGKWDVYFTVTYADPSYKPEETEQAYKDCLAKEEAEAKEAGATAQPSKCTNENTGQSPYEQSGRIRIDLEDKAKDEACRSISLNDDPNHICIDFVDDRDLDSEESKEVFGKEVKFDEIDTRGKFFHDMAKGLQKLEHRYPNGMVAPITGDQCLVSEEQGCKSDKDCKGARTCAFKDKDGKPAPTTEQRVGLRSAAQSTTFDSEKPNYVSRWDPGNALSEDAYSCQQTSALADQWWMAEFQRGPESISRVEVLNGVASPVIRLAKAQVWIVGADSEATLCGTLPADKTYEIGGVTKLITSAKYEVICDGSDGRVICGSVDPATKEVRTENCQPSADISARNIEGTSVKITNDGTQALSICSVAVYGQVHTCTGEDKCAPEPFREYIQPPQGAFLGGQVFYYAPYSKRREWLGTHKLIATKYSLFSYPGQPAEHTSETMIEFKSFCDWSCWVPKDPIRTQQLSLYSYPEQKYYYEYAESEREGTALTDALMSGVKQGTFKEDGSSYSIGEASISTTFPGFGIVSAAASKFSDSAASASLFNKRAKEAEKEERAFLDSIQNMSEAEKGKAREQREKELAQNKSKKSQSGELPNPIGIECGGFDYSIHSIQYAFDAEDKEENKDDAKDQASQDAEKEPDWKEVIRAGPDIRSKLVADYMMKGGFFQLTQDKARNTYSIALQIPREQSGKPEMKGNFVVVVKGSPSRYPNNKKFQMFDRFLIKVTDCLAGKFDISHLEKLQLSKQIISMTPLEVSFQDSDLKVSDAEGCGNLVVKEVGIVEQVATNDSTRDGRALMLKNKIHAHNLLQHQDEEVTDAGVTINKYSIKVFTNNINFIGKYRYRLSVELASLDAPYRLHKQGMICAKSHMFVVDESAKTKVPIEMRTFAECGQATKKRSDCLPYYFTEDPPRTCFCCTAGSWYTAKHGFSEEALLESAAGFSLYELQEAKPTLAKAVDIPIEIQACRVKSIAFLKMDPLVIVSDGKAEAQPEDPADAEEPGKKKTRTFIVDVDKQAKWSLIFDQPRFEQTPNCHSYNKVPEPKLKVTSQVKPTYQEAKTSEGKMELQLDLSKANDGEIYEFSVDYIVPDQTDMTMEDVYQFKIEIKKK